MELGRLGLFFLLVGISMVEFTNCAYRDDDESANGHFDDDADSFVLEDDGLDEGDGSSTTAASTAAKAEDLLREIVNYGLEQGRLF